MSRDYLSRRRGAQHSTEPLLSSSRPVAVLRPREGCRHKGSEVRFLPQRRLAGRAEVLHTYRARQFCHGCPQTVFCAPTARDCLLPQRPAFLFPWRSRYTIALLYTILLLKRGFLVLLSCQFPFRSGLFSTSSSWCQEGFEKKNLEKILTVPLFFVKCRFGDIDSERLLLKQ